MAHRIREAIGNTQTGMMSGVVEVDGAYFGGHAKKANKKETAPTRAWKCPPSASP
jgi:hypothetical protein